MTDEEIDAIDLSDVITIEIGQHAQVTEIRVPPFINDRIANVAVDAQVETTVWLALCRKYDGLASPPPGPYRVVYNGVNVEEAEHIYGRLHARLRAIRPEPGVDVLVLVNYSNGEQEWAISCLGNDGTFRGGYDDWEILNVARWLPLPPIDEPPIADDGKEE